MSFWDRIKLCQTIPSERTKSLGARIREALAVLFRGKVAQPVQQCTVAADPVSSSGSNAQNNTTESVPHQTISNANRTKETNKDLIKSVYEIAKWIKDVNGWVLLPAGLKRTFYGVCQASTWTVAHVKIAAVKVGGWLSSTWHFIAGCASSAWHVTTVGATKAVSGLSVLAVGATVTAGIIIVSGCIGVAIAMHQIHDQHASITAISMRAGSEIVALPLAA